MERFLDLSNRDEVVRRVLGDWLLRELRDELVSRLTWHDPEIQPYAAGLRVRADLSQSHDVYFLTPVGLGGKFFYEHPVGEALYSAEAHVVVEHEDAGLRVVLAQGRLFWVGSDDSRGYRISEGFDALYQALVEALRKSLRGLPRERGPRTTRG